MPTNESAEPGRKYMGTRLYGPEVILAYFVLGGIPLGTVLYGLNCSRRGQRVIGGVLAFLAGVTFLLLLASRMSGYGSGTLRSSLLSILIGIGIMQLEVGPYEAAVAKGALPARWWPPLLAVLGIALLLTVLLWFLLPGDSHTGTL